MKLTSPEDLARERRTWRYTWQDSREDMRRLAVALAWSAVFWTTVAAMIVLVSAFER